MHLEATPDIIVVDTENGETHGSGKIRYDASHGEEVWHRKRGEFWQRVDLTSLTGVVTLVGEYAITLRPGEIYETGMFWSGQGPFSQNPLLLGSITVGCIRKKPAARTLVSDQSGTFGGTWYRHGLRTVVQTDIVLVGAQQSPVRFDASGLPVFENAVRRLTHALAPGIAHNLQIVPLLPGQHYHFAALVTDDFGNWQLLSSEFTTLRRRFTIEFTHVHVYNDGDPHSYGRAMFEFQVLYGAPPATTMIKSFTMPFMDIDDWGETDRPYPMGFAHIGALEAVDWQKRHVCVWSRGLEEDGFAESDEIASSGYHHLPFPEGPSETVAIPVKFRMNCPNNNDTDFHYGVDVRWVVAYEP